jgi:hypothetical protein
VSRRSACWIVLALLSATCGDQGAGPIPIERLTTEMAGVLCQQMSRCCTAMDRAQLPPDFVTILQSKDCARDPTLLGFLDQEFNLARLRQSVQQGRSDYEPADGRRCIDHLGRLSCAAWSGVMNGQPAALGQACVGMVKGTRADGQTCEGNFSHECLSGTCRFTGGGSAICGAAPAAGETCEGSCEDVFDCGDRCAGALVCSPDGTCAADPPPRPTTACQGG